MAISSINPTMSYTSPSFKGAPKLSANGVQKAATVLADAANPSAFQSFKAKWNKGYNNIIDKYITKPILAPVINSSFIGKFAEKTQNIDKMPLHMTTAGSLVTTATYATASLKTLRENEEQKKRAKTLVLNQVLVTTASTVGAYWGNKKLEKITKKLGYKFREANQGNPKLSTYMSGFKIAQGLLIFSLMYRYIAPVVITPVASKIGNYIFGGGKDAKKPEQKQGPTVVPMQVAKELNKQA